MNQIDGTPVSGVGLTNPSVSGERSAPTWLDSFICLVFLGPFTMVVYRSCNWISSIRPDVGTCYFEWERHIPFSPIFVIPYMSYYLFIAGSAFLCRDRQEIRTLVKRVIFATLFSGLCFLLFPLRFGWNRPEVTGCLGPLFGFLNTIDKPFNLIPSLHISLRSIIWPVYGKHLSGWHLTVLNVWFLLIGVSTVFIYQHHVLDVIGGELVAIGCFYLFPSPSLKLAPLSSQERLPAKALRSA